ncbi:hypothetical protein BCR33DRAFT_730682 [Rhizoclosmatium globosum]|uniref:Uncharacterized protein n=1 Tax=Rhizoclosmatium globosum TaxID=329046 RepID=A0A1Y2ABJ3_9FUNG|nr:hypothetical protein BCR33DRAFT_730682 [Rhizoclosmatium globosum]|eukprot:ORY19919.1 hypothetical protein BCR33DRAFT_730682 [Rhizoclosmatium globosum]
MEGPAQCYVLYANGWDSKTTLCSMDKVWTPRTSVIPDAKPRFDPVLPETLFGFIKDPIDASIVAEAVDTGKLPLTSLNCQIRSGVVPGWKDSRMWSPSKSIGRFLLAREVEQIPQHQSQPTSQPSPNRGNQFNLRPGTRLVEQNGLAKRTITLTASSGTRYHIISYFTPQDILHLYQKERPTERKSGFLYPPSEMPEFQDLLETLKHQAELISLPPSMIPLYQDEDSLSTASSDLGSDSDSDYDDYETRRRRRRRRRRENMSPLQLPSSFDLQYEKRVTGFSLFKTD